MAKSNLELPRFPDETSPILGGVSPDGLLGGIDLSKAVKPNSLDPLMDPVDLGRAGADIDSLAEGILPRRTEAPDYSVGPVDVPKAHLYPDRLETDHALLQEPRVRALLATLREREGRTYNKIVGGQIFDDYSRHPNIKVGNSHAAGAYQIQPGTWEPIRKALRLPDFSPASQDLAGVDLLRQLHATDHLLSGNLDAAILAAGRQWLAFPMTPDQKPNARGKMRGIGIKGRPTNTLDEIKADYLKNMR